jgi:protein involved in polysaccharide export with SLBB domain
MRLGPGLVVGVGLVLGISVSAATVVTAAEPHLPIMAPAVQQVATSPAQVKVDGEVKRPGALDWMPNMTVQQAIDLAGGLTDRALQFWITRASDGRMFRSMGELRSVLQPGDALQVTRRPFAGAGPRVNVLGQVKTPGTYTLSAGSNTVVLAMTAAGGLTASAGSDIQILEWRHGEGSGPITEATDRAALSITHISRRSLEENRAPYWLLRSDDTAIWVPEAEVPTSGGRVLVTGDVRTPLDLTFTGTLTLKDAIAKAGGPEVTAGPSVVLTRTAPVAPFHKSRETVIWRDVADGSLDLALRDGDVVDVPRQLFVSISISISNGDGKRETGSMMWSVGLTVQKTLDIFNRPSPFKAGPPPPPIAIDHVKIQRQVDGRVQMLDAAADFVLQPNDKIIVTR